MEVFEDTFLPETLLGRRITALWVFFCFKTQLKGHKGLRVILWLLGSDSKRIKTICEEWTYNAHTVCVYIQHGTTKTEGMEESSKCERVGKKKKQNNQVRSAELITGKHPCVSCMYTGRIQLLFSRDWLYGTHITDTSPHTPISCSPWSQKAMLCADSLGFSPIFSYSILVYINLRLRASYILFTSFSAFLSSSLAWIHWVFVSF